MNYPVASSHDAVGDAIKSVRLYNMSQQLQQDPAAWQQAQVRVAVACFTACHLETVTVRCHNVGMYKAPGSRVQDCDMSRLPARSSVYHVWKQQKGEAYGKING